MRNKQSAFGFSTTGAEVVDKFSENCAKTVIVTGANTGLGLETARCLASKGATVVIASRNKDLGNAAVEKIKSTIPEAKVSFLQLDLASLQSIKDFATEFQSKFKRLDLLINNAGIMACPKSFTSDGFEMQFGVNHLGHFHLTQLLLPILLSSGTESSPARVVNLSSSGQYHFAPKEGIRFDDINATKTYNPFDRYGQSKLCNILFSQEFTKRYKSKNVISVAAHPGFVPGSDLARNFPSLAGWNGLVAIWVAVSEGSKSLAQGVSTTLVAALDPEITPGGYYYNCKLGRSKDLHPAARKPEMATKLWEFSEALISNPPKK